MKMIIKSSDKQQCITIATTLWTSHKHFYTELHDGEIWFMIPEYYDNKEEDTEMLMRVWNILDMSSIDRLRKACNDCEKYFKHEVNPSVFWDVKYLLEKYADMKEEFPWNELYDTENVIFWLNEMLENNERIREHKDMICYLMTMGEIYEGTSEKYQPIVKELYQKGTCLSKEFFV